MDILPSVVATIIGAYIVNHYIVTKPAAEAPVAAAVSPADPNKARTRADTRTDTKPAATSADAGNIPEPGVKAKGISEKAMLEQTAAERPTVVEKSAGAVEKSLEKPLEKPADRPAETASIPADLHRHPPAHDKAVAKSVAAPAVPAVAAAPVEASAPAEEHRDANELARAAIERLRGAGDASPRAQEAARVPDAPRVVSAPSVRRSSPAGSAAAAADHGFDPAGRAIRFGDGIGIATAGLSRRRPRRPAPPDPAGRHPGRLAIAAVLAVRGTTRSARRGSGTAAAGTHQCRRRHAAGGEVGVPRGIAEIAPGAFVQSRS